MGCPRRHTNEAPDLRLAAPALGAWLAALWALHLSTAGAVAIILVAVPLSVVCWHVVRRQRIGAASRLTATLTLGLLLGAISGAASAAGHTAARDAEPLSTLTQQRAVIHADVTVTDDPRRARGDNSVRSRIWLVNATLDRFRTAAGADTAATRVNVRLLILSSHSGWRGLLPGQRAHVIGRLEPARGGDLRAAVLSASEAPETRGDPPLLQRAAGSLRDGLQRAVKPLPDDAGGLLPGLAVGDVSSMLPAVEEDFRATGMTHLTAVSGSNVAIIVGAVLLLTAWCRLGPRSAATLSVIALIGFVILARPSPSVLRAALMGGLALIALASGRPRAAVPGLAVTVYLLVVIDPALAADFGFALSVLATAGLLLLAPRWRDALLRRHVPRGIAEALAVPVAAQAACAPVVAAMTGAVSLIAAPANLLAAPAVAPATIAGVAAAALSPIWEGGAEFLAWLGGWPALWLVTVARWGAGIPGGTATWPGGLWGGAVLAVAVTLLVVMGNSRVTRRILAVAAMAGVLGAFGARAVTPPWPPPGWALVACDVGQGDALVLHVSESHAIVVDAGPAPTSVDRCLRRLDVTTVPLLVISHYHADHIGGLAGVLRGRAVAAIAGPAYDEPRYGRDALRHMAPPATPVLEPGPGWRYRAGQLHVTVLGPEGSLTGTRSDSNNNSLILRVETLGVTILLLGDAEVERQQAMLTHGEPIQADVLKVAHHGSAFQDPRFLHAVDPAVAVVSVGPDNEYGHPNPSLMRRLRVGGAQVTRTDHSGDIAISRTEDGLAITERGRDTARQSAS